jgi:hypothetical protein
MSEPDLSPAQLEQIQRKYDHLKSQLLELKWISQGSVMPQPPNAWRWTRKVKAKTVTVALSQQQALLYKEAIADHRKLELILRKMRDLSQQVLMKSVPGVCRRPR